MGTVAAGMRIRRRPAALVVVLALAAGACGDDGAPASTAASTTAASPTAASPTTAAAPTTASDATSPSTTTDPTVPSVPLFPTETFAAIHDGPVTDEFAADLQLALD
jgi:hypothetical protein